MVPRFRPAVRDVAGGFLCQRGGDTGGSGGMMVIQQLGETVVRTAVIYVVITVMMRVRSVR